MPNPFDKYLGPEARLQSTVFEYLESQYPNALFGHPMNEGRRSKFERYLSKKLRMMTGFPDVMIFESRGSGGFVYLGCAIELKVGNNKPTPTQNSILKKLELRGWYVNVCWNFEDARAKIDWYLKVEG